MVQDTGKCMKVLVSALFPFETFDMSVIRPIIERMDIHSRVSSFNLDYLEVEYVNQDINVDITSPSSQVLTLMHQIHPTYNFS